ncbi:MAG TPA: 3-hydroxyacyl-CoA dehydrogenase family protein [Gemmatimonadales bacterium]|nr:3-hydroxyacyl-CoA dehydrogenase family protein [Gemmatimonadales bacterium]
MTPPRVAVVGAGTMGHGIAYVAARAGCEVTLTDSRPEMLPLASEQIERLLAGGLQRGKLSERDAAAVRERLRPVPSLGDAVRNADVVIEAIFENLAAKRQLFEALSKLTPGHVLLATNTSSLSVGQIAAAVPDPRRVIGMHFFNPVHLMRLVEIVRHDRCSAESVDRAVALAREMGKEPILVRDSPGFASSRLGVALGLEAMRMLEEGVATAEDIDKAMELGYNHPMGPLKLTDLVGLDVRLAIAEYLHRALEDQQFEPPRILRDKVAKGELGKKSGKGFYTWSP